jgi:uridine phosphorylase
VLKELTKRDWLSFLNMVEGRIPRLLILRGTRNLRTNYERHRDLFTDVVEIGSPNGLFEDIFIGTHGDATVGYASVYGGPMASEVAHVFGVLGTEVVIQTGVCGALGHGIEAGDVIVGSYAGCGDGASTCYLPGIETVGATPELVKQAMDLPDIDVPRRSGGIWTTAALLAEGKAEIDQWYDAGYIAADMETASTFAVAQYFGMCCLSVLCAFDNPREGSHLALTESAKNINRAAGEAAMRHIMFSVIDDVHRRPAIRTGGSPSSV